MKCAICGMEIEEGWTPYFFEGETEHECACSGCSELFLQSGEDGEMEVKEEYKGKIKYLDEKVKEHLVMGVMLN